MPKELHRLHKSKTTIPHCICSYQCVRQKTCTALSFENHQSTANASNRQNGLVVLFSLLVLLATAPFATDKRPGFRYLSTLKDAAYEQIKSIGSPNVTFSASNGSSVRGETKQPYIQANNTVVTAFYNLTTHRHSSDEYERLLSLLFTNQDPMIIFTSPDHVDKLAAMRGQPERTLVIGMPINETELSQMGSQLFWEHLGRRMGRTYHVGYEVFWVWNAKSEFLKRGSDLNPFGSRFFAWVDAGMVRWEEYANTTLLQRIPPELEEDRMMLLNVTRVTNRRANLMFGAGIFGGYKPGIDRFHAAYRDTIRKCAEDNPYLVASEQKVMYRACTENPGLCLSIRPDENRNAFTLALQHPMFYMLPFLNEEKYNRMKEEGFLQTTWGDYTDER